MHLPSPSRPLRASRVSDPARRTIEFIGEGGEARVHSVFRSALNIETAGGLLTLAPDAVGGLPNGILLDDTTPLPDLRRVGARPGALVSLEGGILAVSSASFAVDVRPARPWSPRLPAFDAGAWPSRSAGAWQFIRDRAVPGGIESLPTASAAVDALRAAIERQDRPAALASARRLIGLGPGLTPSGDDVLAGVEAGMHATGHPLAGFLADAVHDIDELTTAVSATLLRHAAAGEFAERISRVVGALLCGPELDLSTELDRALAWGATSGGDTLVGMFLGLDAATHPLRAAA